MPGHILIFSKVINGEEYRFLEGHFIYIFKKNIPMHDDIREQFMKILEIIINSYHQDMETGVFKIKSNWRDGLSRMDTTDRDNCESLISRLGKKNLDYIHMVIGLGKISEIIYHGFIQGQASMKSKRKKRRKSKRKKSPRKKKSSKKKKSPKKKKG